MWGLPVTGTYLSGIYVCTSCSVMSDSVDSMDYSPPGSSDHRILQARILEWVAIPFSRDLPDPGIELLNYRQILDRLGHQGSPLLLPNSLGQLPIFSCNTHLFPEMDIKPSITFPRQFCSHCQSNSPIDASLHFDHTWRTSSAAGCLLHCRQILYCLSYQESPLRPPSPASSGMAPKHGPLLMEGGGAFLCCTHLFFLSSFFLSSPVPLPNLFALALRVDLSGPHQDLKVFYVGLNYIQDPYTGIVH